MTAQDVERPKPGASLPVASGLLGVSTVATRLALLVVMALLARGAGAAAVGYYGLATLAASLTATALSFGLPTYLTRGVPSGLVPRPAVARIHCGRLVVLGLAAAGSFPLANGLLPSDIRYGFFLFFAASLLEQWNETAWPLVRGTRTAWLEPLVNGSAGLALVTVCLLDAWRDGLTFGDAASYFVAVAIVRSAAAGLAVGVHRLVKVPAPTELRTHVRRAVPYLSADLLGLLYFRGDVFVLAVLASATQVGEYVSATAVINPAVQVAASMGVGALAYASSRLLPGRPGTDDSRAVFVFFRIAGQAATGVICLALPVAITVLFGGGTDVLPLATILAVFLALRFANYGLSAILLAHGRASSRLVVLVASICANLALNLALDGRYGAFGAAWATVFTELVVGGSFLWFLRSRSLVTSAVAAAAPAFAIAAVMAAVLVSAGPTPAALVTGALFLATAAVGFVVQRRAGR